MSLADLEANRDAELVAIDDDTLDPMTDDELAASCPECLHMIGHPGIDIHGSDELPPYDEFGERSQAISDAGDPYERAA